MPRLGTFHFIHQTHCDIKLLYTRGYMHRDRMSRHLIVNLKGFTSS